MQSGGNPMVKYTWFGRTEPTEYQGPCALTFLGGAWGATALFRHVAPRSVTLPTVQSCIEKSARKDGSDPAEAFGRGVPEGLGNCVLTPAEPAGGEPSVLSAAS